jgi:ribosomal protein S27AE
MSMCDERWFAVYLNCPRCGLSLLAANLSDSVALPCPRCGDEHWAFSLCLSRAPDARSRLASRTGLEPVSPPQGWETAQ